MSGAHCGSLSLGNKVEIVRGTTLEASPQWLQTVSNQSECRDKSSSTLHSCQWGQRSHNSIQAAVCNQCRYFTPLILGTAPKHRSWWCLWSLLPATAELLYLCHKLGESCSQCCCSQGTRQAPSSQAGSTRTRCPEAKEKSENNSASSASSSCLSVCLDTEMYLTCSLPWITMAKDTRLLCCTGNRKRGKLRHQSCHKCFCGSNF